MTILLSGIALYLVSFVIQIAIFRFRLPKRQIFAILIIFISVLVVFLCFTSLRSIECIYLSMVYLAVLPGYAIFYTLIEAESPSGLMVLLLEASGNKGLEPKAFSKLLTDDLFLWHRIAELEKGRYVTKVSDRYFVTARGLFYMKFWLIPRYLMGRHSYGG